MHSGSSGDDSQGRLYHKLGSPSSTQHQPQSTQPSVDPTQGPQPTHTSGYAALPPPRLQQQFIINPATGVQGAILGAAHSTPAAASVPLQTQPVQGSQPGVILQQQQQQQQQLSPHNVARQQALMQLAGFPNQLAAATSSQVVNLQQQQLSPSYVDPAAGLAGRRMSINTPPGSLGAANPYALQETTTATPKLFPPGDKLQISPEQIHVQSLLLPSHHQPVGTIHHHGQGSPRSTMPPLGFGAVRRASSHSPTRGGAPDRKSPVGASGSGGAAYHRNTSSPARTNPKPSSPSRMRKSPLMASEVDRPPATHEVAELRTKLLEHKLASLHELQDSYKDRLAELFFLENGYNMMDFLAWKKRPSSTLHNYMTSRKLEEGHEEEITINDEVKVITNSGSNIPLVTPVAISKQLPPAVSALSSQIKAKELRKSFPGALPTSSPDMDRKRTYSQAGLDGSGTSERKPLAFPSTHEPNVTLSPKTITPIPGLPGSQPAVVYKQQQQQKQHAASQQQQQQQQEQQHHGASGRAQTAAVSGTASHARTSLGVPHARREPKSPPAKHSLHQLKLLNSRPLTITTTTPADVTSTPAVAGAASMSPRRHSSGGAGPSSALAPTAAAAAAATTLPSQNKLPISPSAHQRLSTRQHSLSAVYDYTIGSQEMIVERAKQEAQVMQRIAELRKEGLWSARRLPKVQEPPRNKTHWDYLLEEAQWLATDFVQERRWKKAAARKLVRAVARYHQEKHAKEVKAEREETQKLRRIASNIAKEIKTFWSNIEKVVQYKQQSRLEERRRKAMDMQLDYIVGQTEKYSSWLTEGLNLNAANSSAQGSLASSPRSDPEAATAVDDVDFQPEGDDTDDEETIEVEEREAEQDQDAHQRELELLQRESEVPLEDLIGSLPPEMIGEGQAEAGGEKESPSTAGVAAAATAAAADDDEGKGEAAAAASVATAVTAAAAAAEEEVVVEVMEEEEAAAVKEEGPGLSDVTKEVEDADKPTNADEEFVPSTDDEDEEMPDDEETLDEQEEVEGEVDHSAEVAELEAEGEMSMEELLRVYGGAYDEDFQMPDSSDSDDDEEEEEDEEDATEEEETEEEEEEEEAGSGDEEEAELTDVGMEYLINPDKENQEPTPPAATPSEPAPQSGPNQEITDIAAAAQSLQPTGYTLSTTQVKTPVPFLLRHKLREYQHIGLDWLVTMNDKRLNGILADEMGLGKTIQTIALLAHLACEAANWGPHLIVVPTSVMLNWEMEFKKWCPGFKILTYFGSQKERKQKRQGWTKSNAFHVCITSYKLVIQDHQSFRRKKWKYLVLDEAQNIKNFKSQRWQTLLNFNSQRRLLLTGTPLQNNLMELWSLMHFLMPHVFASHREFREWFSNPLSGMIEGTQEYNEGLIRRLHKVLRPFLLRRLKSEVERQLPQKREHLVRCRLSRRQRFLYDDFMSQAKTRETLSSGHFMSVINVLMQLRKVCNHPDLFEPRPIQSPFQMEGLLFYTASLITKALEYDPHKHVSLGALNMCIASLELSLPAYAAHRIRQLQTPRPLIEEIDSAPEPPPRPQPMKMKPGKLFPPPAALALAAANTAAVTTATTAASSSSQAQREAKTTTGAGAGTAIPSAVLATSQGRASPVVAAVAASSGGRSSPSVSHVLVRSSSGLQMMRQTSSNQPGVVAETQGSPGLSLSAAASTAGAASTSSTAAVPSLTLVSHPAVPSSTPLQQLPGYTGVVVSSTTSGGQQRFYLQPQTSGGGRGQFVTTQPITVQLQGSTGGQGTTIRLPAGQIRQMSQGGIVQIVQTSSGHQVLRPAVRLTSPAVSSQQSNQSRSSPVPIQMTLQASSPQIPRSVLQQGSSPAGTGAGSGTAAAASAQPTTAAAQSHAQTVIQALAQAVTQASSSGGAAASASQSQQLQSVLAQLQRQQLQQQQQQRTLQQQQQQQQQTAGQPTSTQSSTVSLLRTTSSQQGPKPIASVAPMVNATTVLSLTNALPSMVTSAVTSPAAKAASPVKSKEAVKASDPDTKGQSEGMANTTTVSVTTSGSRPAVAAASKKSKISKRHKTDSPFYLESMHHAEVEERSATLARLADLNQTRCSAKPVYGSDLRSAVSLANSARPAGGELPFASGAGLFHCRALQGLPFPHSYQARFSQTDTLRRVVKTPEDILEELEDIIKRFVMVVPMASAPPIAMHTSHPAPSVLNQQRVLRDTLERELKPAVACLHPIRFGMKLQFPELRLIQYDCGKLQALDQLLRRLKPNDHRVLIFTQMTRMLDVLEAFLNYHGHIYVRLDGTTKVEQRQLLMDRFNMDKRIFCFILSTRSGGLGINLTGADTVIFYDSDWNPTMDAQAQDRCHRIGQTRDVHIYRLISEMTVEENILKKANQKRLLVDVSIEGGNFTTAFFKTNTIKDLFDMSSRRDLKPVAIEEILARPEPAAPAAIKAQPTAEEEAITQNQLEQALAKTEDETDVRATSKALAEQDAELAEFDETIPYEGEENKAKEEVSKIEIELAQLDNQLTDIEKYAMRYLEANLEPPAMDEVLEAEEQVLLAKKEWELERLQALKEEEERKAEQEEDEIFFTYCDAEAKNKVYISNKDDIMPIWAPPTPPQDDNDLYIDFSSSLMYETSIMMESRLPPVYMKKEHKKAKVEQGIRKMKPHTKTGEAPHHAAHIMTPPQSLFNRPSAALLRMRREAKQQKLRAMAGKPVVKPLPIVHRAASAELQTADRHEWLINEDWALLQAVQALQELPLTLQAIVPGHVINWDLVSDIVNGTSRIYRSPKQCRHRYDTVIIPREEGKILYDTNPKKQKKSKGIYRTKNNRPMKTSQLHTQDSNASHSMFYSNKFDLVKTVITKRQPYLKQVLNNPLMKNPKHSAVLNDFSINYEKPMSPVQVATKRSERIAKEKKAAQEQQQRQRIQDAQAKQQQQQAAAAVAQPVATATTTAVLSGTINRTALGSTPIRVTGANSIVVNTPGVVTAIPSNSFASINKRMSQQQVGSVTSIAGTTSVMATVASSLAQVVRAPGVRTTVAHVSLPSSAGIITSQVRAAVTSGSQVVITSAGTGSQARTTPTGTATMTAKMAAAHYNLAMIKQQAMKQHMQQQQQQQQLLAQQQVTSQQQAQIKLKQAELKRLQQAQAQAQAAQAQAQAQAQAVQQQLQSGQKPPTTSAVTVSQVAAVVSATSTLSQAQLTQAIQQRRQMQMAGKAISRPLKTEEVNVILKRQQLLAQKNLKTAATITSLPLSTVSAAATVAGSASGTVKGITVSGIAVSPAAAAAAGTPQKGIAGAPKGSLPAKALTNVTIPNFQQQLLQMQKVQQAKQQQLLGVKAQQLLAQQQQKMQTGAAAAAAAAGAVSQGQLAGPSGTLSPAQIRISSPSVSVAVTGSLASQQVAQTTTSQQQRISQQVSALNPQQLQQVRVQRVTTSQPQGSATLVQRVGQVPPLATVRQQLQQQVKQTGAGGGATLSIQQAGKPVTIIPTVSGTNLLTVAKSMGNLSPKHILTQLMAGGNTHNMTQLARVLSQAQAHALAQKGSAAAAAAAASGGSSSQQQPQQTVTVQSVAAAAIAAGVQQQSRAQQPAGSGAGATTSVQAVASGQLAAGVQQQGAGAAAAAIPTGSPVQVTLSTQPTKTGPAQAQQSTTAQRQAALQQQRLVQQAQSQQQQQQQTVKPGGTVQARLQATAAAQQQLQQKLQAQQQQQQLQKVQVQAQQLQTQAVAVAAAAAAAGAQQQQQQAQATLPAQAKVEGKPVEGKPLSALPKVQVQLKPQQVQAPAQAQVVAKAPAPELAKAEGGPKPEPQPALQPTATGSAQPVKMLVASVAQPALASPEQQQQAQQLQQQSKQQPTVATTSAAGAAPAASGGAPVRASPYAMRLRKPSSASKE